MKARYLLLLAVLTTAAWSLAIEVHAQCLFGRLFHRPTTYTAGYGGYPVAVAYTPTLAVLAPAPATTVYRVTYLPVTPGTTQVYRLAPAITPPAVTTTSYLPVVTPYAVPSSTATPSLVPTVTYRPVQIVFEPRRLFRWRPFANLRARRAGSWPATWGTTWTTAYLTSYDYVPVVSSVTCLPAESSISLTASVTSTAGGCVGCTSSTTTWGSPAAVSAPSWPSTAAPSSQPTPTFKEESPTPETRMKPADEGKSTPRASGTSLPLTTEKPLVRQALFEKPIPLVEEESDPPLVEVHGWRRAN